MRGGMDSVRLLIAGSRKRRREGNSIQCRPKISYKFLRHGGGLPDPGFVWVATPR